MPYKPLVLPIFDYCDLIYDCIPVKDSEMLQRLRNLANKQILGVPILANTSQYPRYTRCSWDAVSKAKKNLTWRNPSVQNAQRQSSYICVKPVC